MKFDNGRVYEIESKKSQKIDQAINHTKNLQKSRRLIEQKVDAPVAVDYQKPLQSNFKNSRYQNL